MRGGNDDDLRYSAVSGRLYQEGPFADLDCSLSLCFATILNRGRRAGPNSRMPQPQAHNEFAVLAVQMADAHAEAASRECDGTARDLASLADRVNKGIRERNARITAALPR